MSDIASVVSPEGFTITGNTQTPEAMKEQFVTPPAPKEPPDDHEDPDDDPAPLPEAAKAPDGKVEPKPDEGKNKWSRKIASKRVEQAVIEKNREKARADEIERRALAAEAELAKLRTPKTEAPKVESAKADDRPKADDFPDYDDYLDARDKWNKEQWKKEAQEEQQRALVAEHQKSMFAKFSDRIKAATEKDPELNSKISPQVLSILPPGALDFSKPMTSTEYLGALLVGADPRLLDPEKSVDFMKFFSDNPTELQRLTTLPQAYLLAELVRIDARLGAAPSKDTAPVPTRISSAPAPVRPVTAVAPSSSEPDELPDPKLDPIAWGKKREALEERRRRRAEN